MAITVGPFPTDQMSKLGEMFTDPAGWIARNQARSQIALPGGTLL